MIPSSLLGETKYLEERDVSSDVDDVSCYSITRLSEIAYCRTQFVHKTCLIQHGYLSSLCDLENILEYPPPYTRPPIQPKQTKNHTHM